MVSNLSESKGVGRSRTAWPARMISYVLAGISGQVQSSQCARPFTSVSGPRAFSSTSGGEIARSAGRRASSPTERRRPGFRPGLALRLGVGRLRIALSQVSRMNRSPSTAAQAPPRPEDRRAGTAAIGGPLGGLEPYTVLAFRCRTPNHRGSVEKRTLDWPPQAHLGGIDEKAHDDADKE